MYIHINVWLQVEDVGFIPMFLELQGCSYDNLRGAAEE